MIISHGTRIKNINDTNGYGYATAGMIQSLRRLGHSIEQNDAGAPVEIWFDQPHHWNFKDNQYKIGYHPWESTRLKDDWVDIMNKCDEIWTPSPLIADWYRADGVTVPVYVYEHGVDKVWAPQERKVEDKLKFLHVGGEAARKGASMTMNAFRCAFPDRDDIELTMKMVNAGWKIDRIGRTNIINRTVSETELIKIFNEHHIYAYPSYGEGFGLTPLQAMATGMPTITLPAWAPYERFLDPNLTVSSELRRSPWHTTVHPGKMFRPNFDELVDRFRFAADNYDKCHAFALSQTPNIQREYDWDTITENVFNDLEKRLQNS